MLGDDADGTGCGANNRKFFKMKRAWFASGECRGDSSGDKYSAGGLFSHRRPKLLSTALACIKLHNVHNCINEETVLIRYWKTTWVENIPRIFFRGKRA
jgi:hypothetical protein